MRNFRFRRSRWALLTCAVLALALAITALPLQARTAHAATCLSKTMKFYPGTTSSDHTRWGEVDFHFDVCPDSSPSSWNATVVRSFTNTSGKSYGISFDSTTIYLTSDGGYYSFYTGAVDWSKCVPGVGWPCVDSGEATVSFYAYISVTDNSPHVIYLTIQGSNGLTLYTTP